MSIWGKIVGASAGFALGGPLGALLGAAAGHAVDRLAGGRRAGDRRTGDRPTTTAAEALRRDRQASKQLAFTIGVIVLGAKMAKADGLVTRDEIAAFRRIFQVPEHEQGNVAWLFNRARREAAGFEPYARQIAGLFHRRSRVLEELLDGLFHIARADGVVTPAEIDYLAQVAEIFGFDEADFDRIRTAHLGPDPGDPYRLLGVTRAMSDQEIRAAYRRLARETHPDRLIAKGMPQEFVDLANEKMATINAAWDRVAQERGLR
jgi:DnaJ like chaperone protein